MTLYTSIKLQILLNLLIMMAMIYFGFMPDNEVKIQEEEIIEDVAAPSINQLIDNTMSEGEGTERFDRTIRQFMYKWGMKGASFALMKDDSLIYAKGYGYSNLEDSVLCDVNNVFRVASVSKLITATAIMKLYEEGLLNLDTQVFGQNGVLNDTIFLNIRDKNLEKIKVGHLLRHTSGFSSPIGDPAFNLEGVARTIDKPLPLTLDDVVVYATKNKLRTQPGGSYRYSNLGYIVLAKVIESVTSMDYETYVKDSVLAPAGCHDMYVGRNFMENHPENEVRYYEVKEAEMVTAYDGSGRMTMKSNGGNDVNLISGAGGWVASPVELLKFVAAINGNPEIPDILKPSTVKLMTMYSKKKHPIGWASVTETQWKRSGSMSGTCSYIKKQTDGYTWAFITNSSTWIGPRISSSIDYNISRAIARVKEWPDQNLFKIEEEVVEDSTTNKAI